MCHVITESLSHVEPFCYTLYLAFVLSIFMTAATSQASNIGHCLPLFPSNLGTAQIPALL